MTEEIMIDGVDVSECCFYNNGKCDNPNGTACNCINNAVCYFKELKHLQRENKEKIDIIEQMIKILYPNANDDELYDVTFNGEYIDELKELKDTADTMLMANDIKKLDIDSLREANDRLEQENKELLEARNHFMAINLKYYNALEEIRILATKNVSIESFVKIQNRINEVLE